MVDNADSVDSGEDQFKLLKTLLPDTESPFPVGKGIQVVGGKTLSRTRDWWKAFLLIKTSYTARDRYQLRLYGWRKNKEGVYKTIQKFNVSLASYLGDVVAIMQAFAQSGRTSVYEKLILRINELQAKAYSTKQVSNLPGMRVKIKEFNSLIDGKKTNERQIHTFLRENTWMFGTNYTRMFHSEKVITIKSRNDFLLQNFSGNYDIVDLKSPNADLFVTTRGKRQTLSKDLKDAISQVMFYLAEARTHYLTIKEDTGLDIYFPVGIIVIGRRKDSDKKFLQIHNEYLNKINIITYDELLDRAKKTVETYEKKVGRSKKQVKT